MCKLFLASIVFATGLTGIVRADDDADAKAILDSAIKAAGGETALSKPVAFYYKFKGTVYDGDNKTPINAEWFIQGYDKERSVSFGEDGKAAEIEVLNGKDCWLKVVDQPTELQSDEQLQYHRELIYVNWVTMLAPLNGKEFHLSKADDTVVDDRKAMGIKVEHDKHQPIKLYFDKENKLLVKYTRKLKDPDTGKDVDEECVFSDYRDVQQTKQPFKADVTWDGAKYLELALTQVKLHEKPLDDKLFEKP
jgi:hypothetical protein